MIESATERYLRIRVKGIEEEGLLALESNKKFYEALVKKN